MTNNNRKTILAVGFKLSAPGTECLFAYFLLLFFFFLSIPSSFVVYICSLIQILIQCMHRAQLSILSAMHSIEKLCNNRANNDGEAFSNLNSKLFLVDLASFFSTFAGTWVQIGWTVGWCAFSIHYNRFKYEYVCRSFIFEMLRSFPHSLLFVVLAGTGSFLFATTKLKSLFILYRECHTSLT